MSTENLTKEEVDLEAKREGKIFVGGLTWDTTVEDIKTYFRKFGNVIDASIIKDPITGRSRGFGFVVFDEDSTIKKVFDVDSHSINGKKVDTKNAFRRNSEPSCRKIFVGGVDPLLSENEIRTYFSTFGQIEEIDFPWDKEKNQRRAFCFVAFVSPDVVEEILKQSKHKLGDRMVDVKKATPKQDNNSGSNNSTLAWSLISQALNLNSNYSNNNNTLLASLLGSQQPQMMGGGFNGFNNNALAGLSNNPNVALQAALQAAQNNSPSNRLPSSAAAIAAAAAAAAVASGAGNHSQFSQMSQGDDLSRMHSQGNLNGSNMDGFSGLNYPAPSGQGNQNLNGNPYFALAAAAAAAGIYPPASSSLDLASWYSNLAVAAAAAASHDGHGLASPMHHQNSHRDMPPPVSHHGHGGSAGSHILSGNHSSSSGSGYGKASRSSTTLSPNAAPGSSGHRNTTQFHPYSR